MHQEPYTHRLLLFIHYVNSADSNAHVHGLAGILTDRTIEAVNTGRVDNAEANLSFINT